MLRVVAGKYKNKRLFSPNANTRPSKTILKEALFSSLGNINDKTFLDLFSGSGAMGIEAISRGAKEVILVENDLEAIKTIKLNLENINDNIFLKEEDVFEFLYSTSKKFDYIFADPPYRYPSRDKIFKTVLARQLLNDNAILIYEEINGEIFNMPTGFKCIKHKHYGISHLYYFKEGYD